MQREGIIDFFPEDNRTAEERKHRAKQLILIVHPSYSQTSQNQMTKDRRQKYEPVKARTNKMLY